MERKSETDKMMKTSEKNDLFPYLIPYVLDGFFFKGEWRPYTELKSLLASSCNDTFIELRVTTGAEKNVSLTTSSNESGWRKLWSAAM